MDNNETREIKKIHNNYYYTPYHTDGSFAVGYNFKIFDYSHDNNNGFRQINYNYKK